ncbi:alpha/beta hydrolase [Ktedonosporobacter rubrisoli]|nr:alpha/beta hydrolase [Ktedonosporobacter rubrisoli]
MAFHADVVYGLGNDRELRLDIFPPDPHKNQRTAVLLVHGGGWRRNSRHMLRPHAEKLSSLGFTCCTVEYRFVQEAPWPAPLHDVKAAIRWARSHAEELGIDPERIVLQGYSSGGHLSLIAAGTPDQSEFEGKGGCAGVSTRVAAAMAVYPALVFFRDPEEAIFGNHYPPADEAAWEQHKLNQEGFPSWPLLGLNATAEAMQQVSPFSYISPAFPPTLLLHGTSDIHVPYPPTVRFHQALLAAGVQCDLHLYSGQSHGFDLSKSFRDVVQEEAALFFRRIVSEPEMVNKELKETTA